MSYVKPEVVRLRQAIEVIQGSTQKGCNQADTSGDLATAAAYEADE
jgi:hypothetical protein